MSAATDPRVTVIIPTYRRPDLLVDSLGSVVGGSYVDIEILVVNDGPERDLEAAQRAYPDPRISWITRANRLGMLENHLDAFRRSRGAFVACLDDDDRWDPSFLSTLVPILEAHPEVVVAFTDHYVTDPIGAVDRRASDHNSRRWRRASLAEGLHRPFHRLAVVNRSISMACSSVLRKDALRLSEYPPEVGTCWDVWTSYLLAVGGGAAWYVPRRLSFYRVHAGSATASSRMTTAASAVYCWELWLRDPVFAAWRPDLKATLAASHLRLAAEQLRRRRIGAGVRHLGRGAWLALGAIAPAYRWRTGRP